MRGSPRALALGEVFCALALLLKSRGVLTKSTHIYMCVPSCHVFAED